MGPTYLEGLNTVLVTDHALIHATSWGTRIILMVRITHQAGLYLRCGLMSA